mmetsp:Transcript_503/g.1436  ORF Transcript_503/g.1436 Transcript_503/m.1436 type:complete len:204 (+) Transcript_503:504-1115(+)
MELALQHLLELMQLDGSGLVDIQLYEGVPHLGPLVHGQGPRHHRHTSAAEGGGLAEGTQGVHDTLVQRFGLQCVPLRDPGMLQGRLGGESDLRIHHQQRAHEVLARGRDPLPDVGFVRELSSLDVAHLLLLGSREGHVAEEHDEYRDTHTPHVALRVVALREHLRRHVSEGAATHRHFPVVLGPNLAKPEVDELQVVVALLLK